jgi:hypothetical protein
MVIDTSDILLNEPDTEDLSRAIAQDSKRAR